MVSSEYRQVDMSEINSLRSWREILEAACENPQKKQEIANAVGFVAIRTIDRWISGQSNPQKAKLLENSARLSTARKCWRPLNVSFQKHFSAPDNP